MTTLVEAHGIAHGPTWYASLVVLCEHFADDDQVWDHVVPGERCDLTPLLRDSTRPMVDRVLLAVAQSFHDPTVVVPFAVVVALPDRRLRSVLDALAISRGGLGGLPLD